MLSAWPHLGWLQQSGAVERLVDSSLVGLVGPMLPNQPPSPVPAGWPPVGSCTAAASSAPGLRPLVGGMILLIPLLFGAAPRPSIPSRDRWTLLTLVSVIERPG
jgi:hypothetical protein